MIGAAALAAACSALAGPPPGALELHEGALRQRLVKGLARLDGVQLHRIWDDSTSSIGVVPFTVEGYEPGLVAAVLSAEHGIGVRDGKFCAHRSWRVSVAVTVRCAPASASGRARTTSTGSSRLWRRCCRTVHGGRTASSTAGGRRPPTRVRCRRCLTARPAPRPAAEPRRAADSRGRRRW